MRIRQTSEICPKCKKRGFVVQAWRRKSYYADTSAMKDFDTDKKVVIGKKRYGIRMGHYDRSRPYHRRWCNLRENIHYERISLKKGNYRVRLIRIKLPAITAPRNRNVRYNGNTKSRSDIRLNRLIYNAKNYKDYRFISDVIRK